MAFPTYKEIIELIKKGATIEAQEKVMELREACMELQDDNLNLKARVRELESQLKVRASLRFVRRLYYTEGDAVPFCPHCYESSESLLHLIGPTKLTNDREKYKCLACMHDFIERDEGNFIGMPSN